MPLGAPFKSVTIWDGVEKRFRKRLAMWKRQYISKGGRITLIRSTLFNLPMLQLPGGGQIKVGANSERFLVGRWSFSPKTSLSNMGNSLYS